MYADRTAEEAVVGSIALNNSVYFNVAERLRTEDFTVPEMAALFEWMGQEIIHGRVVDAVTVRADLRVAFVKSTESVASSARWEGYTDIVRQHSVRRSILAFADQAKVAAGDEDADQALSKVESDALALRRDRPGEGMVSFGSVSQSLVGKLKHRAETGMVRGRPTNLRCLDNLIGGLIGGQVIVVAGRPSMGKTSFATELVLRVVADKQSVGAFFSLETTKDNLTARLIGQLTNIPTRRINNAQLTKDEWAVVDDCMQSMDKMRLFIDDGSIQTETSVLSRCRQLAKKEGRLDVVAIDYLQLMRPAMPRRHGSKNDEVAEISRGLKILAKDLNVPVLLLSQLNREVDKRPDPRPNMSDLRDSGAIEQDADVILFPFRPCVYNPKIDQRDVEIIVAKQKDGPVGTARAIWDPESMCFDDPR